MKGEIKAICISDVRGVQKKEIGEAKILEGWGIEGDAHGGDWHRQISLLSYDKVLDFNKLGAGVSNGDFAENILVEGIDLRNLPVGTRLKVNEAELEVTQIGKECHQHCQIYRRVGDCIMPREGIFAKVITGGGIKKGDVIEVV